jgi:hypothetical protein
MLNDVEVNEQYQVKITNRHAALEDLDDNVGTNRADGKGTQNVG